MHTKIPNHELYVVLLFYLFFAYHIHFFSLEFFFQVGACRTRQSPKPKVHTGIDINFVDVPKNLCVPSISASSLDVP